MLTVDVDEANRGAVMETLGARRGIAGHVGCQGCVRVITAFLRAA